VKGSPNGFLSIDGNSLNNNYSDHRPTKVVRGIGTFKVANRGLNEGHFKSVEPNSATLKPHHMDSDRIMEYLNESEENSSMSDSDT